MRCLTVHQPWAELIARGEKKVENRTWVTLHRGPLAIHAGGTHKNVSAVPGDEWSLEYPEFPHIEVDERNFGVIVAVVDVVECLEYAACQRMPFASGPWCWVLENARRLPSPIAIPGRQGLWNLPPKVASAVNRQLL